MFGPFLPRFPTKSVKVVLSKLTQKQATKVFQNSNELFIMQVVKVKKLSQLSIIPHKSPNDAGWDIHCIEEIEIPVSGKFFFSKKKNVFSSLFKFLAQKMCSTGISLEFPNNIFCMIKSRSSLALHGCHVNAGIVDSSYRGEIKVLLHNSSQDIFRVQGMLPFS